MILTDNSGRQYDLFGYQISGVDLLLSHPRYILYWDCGVGKTLALIAALNQLPRGKVLIASPKSVRFDMWEKLGIPINHDVTYLHYDMFPRITNLPTFDYIIFDECHKIKGCNTQTARIASKLSKKAKVVWGASATIAANSYIDTFRILRNMGVAEFQYPDSAFIGRYYNTYSFPVATRYGTKNISKPTTVRLQFADELSSTFAQYCDSINLDDVQKLPERHEDVIYVDGMATPEYSAIEAGIIALSDEDISIVAKLEACAKARQAAGGFIYYNDIDTGKQLVKNLFPDKNPKIEALRKYIREHKDENIIIAYSFIYEKEMLERMLAEENRAVTDEVSLLPYANTFLRQISRGEGLNLQTWARRMVMYSYDYSYIEWTQMQGRIYRVGQTKETYFTSLISRGTIDEKVYHAVQTKQTIDEYLRSVTRHSEV